MKGSWDFERDPLAALRDGRGAPFEEFVRTEARTLLGFFRRLGADGAEAEDLTQEVFLKLFRSARGYQPRERFAAYVMRIARNAWIDLTRRGAARPRARSLQGAGQDAGSPAPLEPEARDAHDPGRDLSIREQAARLRAAIAELPEGQRLAFEMGVVQEMPYAEIARVLDVPIGTVKSRVFAAVRRLRASEAPGATEAGPARGSSAPSRAGGEEGGR